MELAKKKIVYVVNVDWFFVSHRLPLAKEALKSNMDVFLITKNTGKFTSLEEIGIKCFDVNFDRSGKNIFKQIYLLYSLAKLFFYIKPDYVHHVTLKISIYGSLIKKILNFNFVNINAITGLGYYFVEGRKSFGKIIIKILMKMSFSDKKSNFIFQNPDDMLLFSKMNFLEDTSYIIIKGSGVDENYFRITTPRKHDSQKIKIILLSRMLKDKGVFEFIQAARILKKKYSNILEFTLVGKIDVENPAGFTQYEMESFIDNPYINWIGHQEDVKSIYKKADIVCLPSYREGLPLSLVEAMAMECPIITTDVTGCRECVEDNYNGFLVPVKDYITLSNKILLLALDEELRQQMAINSRKNHSNGVMKKTAPKVENIANM
jgi:glycosyltransferase involved in cell wall biosynthesis